MLSDLRELKKTLEIDEEDTQEDAKLNFLVEWASAWIGERINRPGFDLKQRTEYYYGSGGPNLLLRYRPVYPTPTIRVWRDYAGRFGEVSGAFADNTELTWGDDFGLRIDQEDGTSRSGILVRFNDFWPKAGVRQVGYLSPFVAPTPGSIKVQYTAGWTVDTLPANFRLATNLLVQRLRMIMPLGAELGNESYEERSIGVITSAKTKLMALIDPLIFSHRNWTF